MGIEGRYLHIIKAIYDKTVTSFSMVKKLKAFPLRSRTRQGCPLLQLLFKIVLEVLATEIREAKGKEEIQIGKEEVKLSLFADDMILYTEYPKDATRKLLSSSVNLVKLQDMKLIHRNLLHSYTLTTKIRKRN